MKLIQLLKEIKINPPNHFEVGEHYNKSFSYEGFNFKNQDFEVLLVEGDMIYIFIENLTPEMINHFNIHQPSLGRTFIIPKTSFK